MAGNVVNFYYYLIESLFTCFYLMLGKVKGEKMFAFSFIKLLKDDGTVIHDDKYTTYIYKVRI